MGYIDAGIRAQYNLQRSVCDKQGTDAGKQQQQAQIQYKMQTQTQTQIQYEQTNRHASKHRHAIRSTGSWIWRLSCKQTVITEFDVVCTSEINILCIKLWAKHLKLERSLGERISPWGCIWVSIHEITAVAVTAFAAAAAAAIAFRQEIKCYNACWIIILRQNCEAIKPGTERSWSAHWLYIDAVEELYRPDT